MIHHTKRTSADEPVVSGKTGSHDTGPRSGRRGVEADTGEGSKSAPLSAAKQAHRHVFQRRVALRRGRDEIWTGGAKVVYAWVCKCGETGYPIFEASA